MWSAPSFTSSTRARIELDSATSARPGSHHSFAFMATGMFSNADLMTLTYSSRSGGVMPGIGRRETAAHIHDVHDDTGLHG